MLDRTVKALPDDVRPPLLLARGLTKSFGGTAALAGADLELREREIHGLLGASGSGKSTLAQVIAGHELHEGGELTYRTYPVRFRSVREALRVGITIVMQDASLVPDLTVLENLVLPSFGRTGHRNSSDLRQRALDLLHSLGQRDGLPLDDEVRRLSTAQKQIVEIAKAIGTQAKLMIFDEPTASLSSSETDRLFDIMARLRLSGRGLVYVSRHPEEMSSIADRITVMRDGQTVMHARQAKGLSQADLLQAMAGADVKGLRVKKSPAVPVGGGAPAALDVRHLASGTAVMDVSLTAYSGQVVGLGGLKGSGRCEAVEAIFGLRPREAGSVTVGGAVLRPHRPRDAIRSGLAFMAADRRAHSVVPDLSVKDNLLLAELGAGRSIGQSHGEHAKRVDDMLARLGVLHSELMNAPILQCSAGLQQQVVLARWLLLDPKVLIIDEPTQGVDSAARVAIKGLLRDIAAQGTAVVVVSSDPDDLLDLSDRIVVISDGYTVADVPTALLGRHDLALLAAPRRSMTRISDLLRDVTEENGGTGFWSLLDENRVICLDQVVSDPDVDPGLRAGEAWLLAETRIPEALRRREAVFVHEEDEPLSTLLVPIRSPRGLDLGWIGLSLPSASNLPPPEAVKFRIDRLVERL